MQAACNTYGDARRGNLVAQNAGNTLSARGMTRWGSLQHSPRSRSWWGWVWLPLPKNPIPRFELRPSPVPALKKN